jgi:multicomponent Na+:H+ antiporter subunit B
MSQVINQKLKSKNELLINKLFFLISLLLITTFFIFKNTSLISIVALTGAFTLLCSAIYVNLDAVDVAFTEAAVGSGISTILMVVAAAKLPEGKKNKLINLFPSIIIAISISLVLILIISNLPLLGDPNAPIHLHVVPEYIKESKDFFHIPNVVTNILASYRGFDTLGETIVIFTAGLGVIVLLTSNTLNRKTKFKNKEKK